MTSHHGLRVTTPARTILDLAATITTADLDRTINEAHASGRATATELHSLLARNSCHRGATRLRGAIDASDGMTRSRGERLLQALIRKANLPRPQTNIEIEGHEVDAYWPAHNLIVEIDGWRAHQSRHAFERDRRKDADLQARGYRVIRITYRQLTDEPERVIATLAALLATV